MNRRDLNQIYDIKREIKLYEEELNEMRMKSLAKGQNITGMPFVSGTTDKVGNLAVDIADTTRILEGRLIELRKKELEVYEFIGTIEESWMRQIVYMRCVNCLSWNKIADKMGGENTGNTVSKSYYRYLDKQFGKDK